MGDIISVPYTCYCPGDAITVTYDMKHPSYGRPNYTKGSCWIGLIPSHITSDDEKINCNNRVSAFTVYQDKGQSTLRTSTPGTYTIKCFANEYGGKKIAQFRHDIIVGPRGRANVTVYDTTCEPNKDIRFWYDLRTCNYSSGRCWIGLIPSHISSTSETTNNKHKVDCFYVSQNTPGYWVRKQLRTSKVGKYRIKCFANDNGGELLYDGQDIITITNIENELASIQSNPSKSRHDLYELAKKTYKDKGKPVIIDTQDVLSDIRQNANHYKNVALPLNLGQDKPFSEWNEQQFKQGFSRKFNIPIKCIEIMSVRAGSCIIDLQLKSHSDGNKLLMDIECIAENISNAKAKKALVEFGIFAMEFGKVTAGFDITRQKVIMNPRWNRAYGKGSGETNWDGALDDGKSRGNEDYYCPRGWKRFAIQFEEQALDFVNTYDKWPIAYHGTKFDFSMMITLSGLKATGGNHGDGVYLSPCIEYCAHPRYAKPVKLDLSKAKQQQWTSEHINEFRKYDGKWIQVVFACRVKPGSYKKGEETMEMKPTVKIHPDYSNDDIEWIVSEGYGNMVGPERILIDGVMIRASDEYPLSLPESHWWKNVKWYNHDPIYNQYNKGDVLFYCAQTMISHAHGKFVLYLCLILFCFYVNNFALRNV